MIIFGYHGGKRKDLGEALPMSCPRCNNLTTYRWMSVTSWFSLFFVPLIPLRRHDYLVCPICTRAVELTRDQREMAANLVSLTRRFRAGELAQDDYLAQLRAVGGASRYEALPATGAPPATGELPPPPPV
jgi:hypothetical protein